MDWIPLYRALSRHPKSRRLSRALEVEVAQVVGHLCLLWSWAVEWAPDGDLSKYSGEDITDACMWTGDPLTLMDSLETSGFMDADGKLHDWDQYTGKHLAKWEADRARKRRGTSAEPPRQLHDSGTEPRRIDVDVDLEEPEPKTLARNNGGRGVAEGKAVRGSPEAAPGGNQPSATEPAGFAEFYAAFPGRRDRGHAEIAYRKALKVADADTLLDGAVRFAADPNLPADRSKIPYPATWLNGKRWLDDPLPAQLAAVGGRFHRDDPLPPEVS